MSTDVDAGAAVRFVDPTLVSATDPVVLRGGRCAACATRTFPMQPSCPLCFAEEMTAVDLPRTGTVWSWTSQHFGPKPPYRTPAGGFTPYLLGYVDLGDNLVVEARLEGDVADPPAIGDPVVLTTIDAFTDDDGTVVRTFAFTAAPEVAR